jgi:hypothetical protein
MDRLPVSSVSAVATNLTSCPGAHAPVADVIFTASAVQSDIDGYHRLVEGDKVLYRLFSDEIVGAKLAADVWKKTL